MEIGGKGSSSQRWTEAEDRILYAGFLKAETYVAIGLKCGRSDNGVRRRLVRLGLLSETGKRNSDPPLFNAIRARFHGGNGSVFGIADREGGR